MELKTKGDMNILNKDWAERAREYALKVCDNNDYHATISDLRSYSKLDYLKGASEMQEAVLKEIAEIKPIEVNDMLYYSVNDIIKSIKNIKPNK